MARGERLLISSVYLIKHRKLVSYQTKFLNCNLQEKWQQVLFSIHVEHYNRIFWSKRKPRTVPKNTPVSRILQYFLHYIRNTETYCTSSNYQNLSRGLPIYRICSPSLPWKLGVYKYCMTYCSTSSRMTIHAYFIYDLSKTVVCMCFVHVWVGKCWLHVRTFSIFLEIELCSSFMY